MVMSSSSNKKGVISIPLILAVVSASSAVASFSMAGHALLPAAYAGAATTEDSHNNNKDHSHKQDKVKVDCNYLAVVLVALRFSVDNLSEDERVNVDSSLNEGEVPSDLQLILDHNLADLLRV